MIFYENIKIKGNYEEIFSDEISPEISRTLLEIMEFRETKSKNLSPNGGPGASDMMLQADMPMYLLDSG